MYCEAGFISYSASNAEPAELTGKSLSLYKVDMREFELSQSWIPVRQLLILVISEDGLVIFNCICISSAYE